MGEARPEGNAAGAWENRYRYLPWEDWRAGRPAVLGATVEVSSLWAREASSNALRRAREDKIELTFGSADLGWNEERVLERYELLYAARLVPRLGVTAPRLFQANMPTVAGRRDVA